MFIKNGSRFYLILMYKFIEKGHFAKVLKYERS